jgi:hypothetical protein
LLHSGPVAASRSESCVSAPSCAQKFDREAFCDRAVVDDIHSTFS